MLSEGGGVCRRRRIGMEGEVGMDAIYAVRLLFTCSEWN